MFSCMFCFKSDCKGKSLIGFFKIFGQKILKKPIKLLPLQSLLKQNIHEPADELRRPGHGQTVGQGAAGQPEIGDGNGGVTAAGNPEQHEEYLRAEANAQEIVSRLLCAGNRA